MGGIVAQKIILITRLKQTNERGAAALAYGCAEDNLDYEIETARFFFLTDANALLRRR